MSEELKLFLLDLLISSPCQSISDEYVSINKENIIIGNLKFKYDEDGFMWYCGSTNYMPRYKTK